jgi:hypothetical protein
MMFALIRTIGPIAAMLLGLGGGSLLIGGLGVVYNVFIDNPHVVAIAKATAEAECRIRVLEAADAAEKAERDRQSKASEAAIKAFLEAADERQLAQEALQDQLEQEISDYEKQLTAEGRQCLTDGADVDWLRGNAARR